MIKNSNTLRTYTKHNKQVRCPASYLFAFLSLFLFAFASCGTEERVAVDGDTVTVNIISGKATGLTGLVAGTNYYVGGDGSLSISGESSNQFCKAISTSECLITKIN